MRTRTVTKTWKKDYGTHDIAIVAETQLEAEEGSDVAVTVPLREEDEVR